MSSSPPLCLSLSLSRCKQCLACERCLFCEQVEHRPLRRLLGLGRVGCPPAVQAPQLHRRPGPQAGAPWCVFCLCACDACFLVLNCAQRRGEKRNLSRGRRLSLDGSTLPRHLRYIRSSIYFTQVRATVSPMIGTLAVSRCWRASRRVVSFFFPVLSPLTYLAAHVGPLVHRAACRGGAGVFS